MTNGGASGEQTLRPVLRWAGGKRWLVPTLPNLLSGLTYNNFHEPFLGGGSVFLGLAPTGKSFLRDLNAELIETYTAIRDSPDGVANHLSKYRNTSAEYYRARAEVPAHSTAKAARFIFLNHTSFNGIYRVNLNGDYNVPYGRRKVTKMPDLEHLRLVAKRLQSAELDCGDFADCLHNINADDLVFLDPPYTVAHNNNGFIKYNQKLFSFHDQGRLSELIDTIKERKAYYVLTNAAHSSIAELFDKGDRRLKKTRRNSVGGSEATRGSATEYVFTNIPDDA